MYAVACRLLRRGSSRSASAATSLPISTSCSGEKMFQPGFKAVRSAAPRGAISVKINAIANEVLDILESIVIAPIAIDDRERFWWRYGSCPEKNKLRAVTLGCP